MIRYLFNKMLLRMQYRYDYDVQYMQNILQNDLGAFFKYMGFQTMAAHTGGVPSAPLFAARLRAILWDDCGSCTQLIVNLALESKVQPNVIHAIIAGNLDELPNDVALVVRFTELVLAHNPEADELREKIRALWGNKGLIAIGFSIGSSRVYPAFKYSLGYGAACSRITVGGASLEPNRDLA